MVSLRWGPLFVTIRRLSIQNSLTSDPTFLLIINSDSEVHLKCGEETDLFAFISREIIPHPMITTVATTVLWFGTGSAGVRK